MSDFFYLKPMKDSKEFSLQESFNEYTVNMNPKEALASKVYRTSQGKDVSITLVKGVNRRLKIDVVVKLLAKELFDENENELLDQVENAVLLGNQSPRFVKLLFAEPRKDRNVAVLEICDGGSLHDFYLRNNQPGLDPLDALQIMSQIKSAMKIFWNEVKSHRNLKPTKILFHQNKIKISTLNNLRVSGKQTSLYAAPESYGACRPPPNYDFRAQDVFTLGMIFYEMIYDKLPDVKKPLECPNIEGIPSHQAKKIIRALENMLQVDATKRWNHKQFLAETLFDLPEAVLNLEDLRRRFERKRFQQAIDQSATIEQLNDICNAWLQNLNFILRQAVWPLYKLLNSSAALELSQVYKILCLLTKLCKIRAGKILEFIKSPAIHTKFPSWGNFEQLEHFASFRSSLAKIDSECSSLLSILCKNAKLMIGEDCVFEEENLKEDEQFTILFDGIWAKTKTLIQTQGEMKDEGRKVIDAVNKALEWKLIDEHKKLMD